MRGAAVVAEVLNIGLALVVLAGVILVWGEVRQRAKQPGARKVSPWFNRGLVSLFFVTGSWVLVSLGPLVFLAYGIDLARFFVATHNAGALQLLGIALTASAGACAVLFILQGIRDTLVNTAPKEDADGDQK